MSSPVPLLNSKPEAGITGCGALRSLLDIEGGAVLIDISVSIKRKIDYKTLALFYPVKM